MISTVPVHKLGQDAPNTLQVPFVDFECDWETASECIRPFPGYVYVQMSPYREKRNGLFLLDGTKRAERGDVGVVLAVGEDRTEPFIAGSGNFEPPLPLEVRPGDTVLVDPYRGDIYEGFAVGFFRTKSVVRVYGDASRDEWQYRGRQIDECIMAKIEKKTLRPIGRFVLIKREPLKETSSGGILLQERDKERRPFASIVAVSSAAEKAGKKPGMRVQYRQMCVHPLKMYELELADEILDLEGPLEDYALIPHDNITAEL